MPGLPKSLGQKVSAQSTSVTIASDQSAIPITGSITAINPSVGSNFTTAPTSSTLVGYYDSSGKLQPFTGNSTGITVSANQGTNPWVVIVPGGVGITNTPSVAQGTSPWVSSIPGGVGITNTPTVNQGTSPWIVSVPNGVGITNTVASNQTQVSGASISLGQKTMANSYPVTIASDQVAPKTYINASATLNQSLVVGSGVAVTFSAPANSIGFIAMASSSNAQNVRCASGTTATTSLGLRLEPGRDTGFVPSGANLTCIAES